MRNESKNTGSVMDVEESLLALLGQAQGIAYIRPLIHRGQEAFAVCAEDGTRLALFSTYDEAYFTARQHNLEPVSVH